MKKTGFVAIVGRANVGKSTLLNYLCNENVYAENRLFATLDATARKFTIDGEDYLLIDTVGFLRDLPHNLIEAFRSTLESVLNCELAVIVCDAAADFDMQMKTTLGVLHSLNFSAPYIVAVNKSDMLDEDARALYPAECVFISAKTGAGTDDLKRRISEMFRANRTECSLLVPYSRLKEYSKLKNYVIERSVDYTDDGVFAVCSVENERLALFSDWIVR